LQPEYGLVGLFRCIPIEKLTVVSREKLFERNNGEICTLNIEKKMRLGTENQGKWRQAKFLQLKNLHTELKADMLLISHPHRQI
jgi:hypothetical protein